MPDSFAASTMIRKHRSTSKKSEWNDAVLSRDGSELYVTVGVAQNRTSMMVNFGDRPEP